MDGDAAEIILATSQSAGLTPWGYACSVPQPLPVFLEMHDLCLAGIGHERFAAWAWMRFPQSKAGKFEDILKRRLAELQPDSLHNNCPYHIDRKRL
jgi:hypothetical protein